MKGLTVSRWDLKGGLIGIPRAEPMGFQGGPFGP